MPFSDGIHIMAVSFNKKNGENFVLISDGRLSNLVGFQIDTIWDTSVFSNN